MDPILKIHRPSFTHQRIKFGYNDKFLGIGHANGDVSFIEHSSMQLSSELEGSIVNNNFSQVHGNGLERLLIIILDVVSGVSFDPLNRNLLVTSCGSREGLLRDIPSMSQLSLWRIH